MIGKNTAVLFLCNDAVNLSPERIQPGPRQRILRDKVRVLAMIRSVAPHMRVENTRASSSSARLRFSCLRSDGPCTESFVPVSVIR